MTNMPDDGVGRQQWDRQGTVGPDVPAQPGAPPEATRQQPAPPPQDAFGPAPSGQSPYDQPSYRHLAVVPEAETKVTGRRVVQYIFDYIVAGIIPALAYWLFDRNTASTHSWGWAVATVIALAVYFLYWVVIPYGHRGQTFGMQLTRIHVISKNGEKASMLQLFVRGVFLIIDTILWGLVGFITILCSRHRQRIGDHVAKTVVVPISFGPQI
jgi:uncharacterized RDD family membrane protein YckC